MNEADVLEKTWTNCLLMWKWISENWTEGDSVSTLKRVWLRKRGLPDIINNCFFCKYAFIFEKTCRFCPGKLVEISFNCVSVMYHCNDHPTKFYEKLIELNEKRLSK